MAALLRYFLFFVLMFSFFYFGIPVLSSYTIPCAIIAFATFRNPATFAPLT